MPCFTQTKQKHIQSKPHQKPNLQTSLKDL